MDYEYWLKMIGQFKFNYRDVALSKINHHTNAKSVKHKYHQYKTTVEISKKYWQDLGVVTHLKILMMYYAYYPINKMKEFIYKEILSNK